MKLAHVHIHTSPLRPLRPLMSAPSQAPVFELVLALSCALGVAPSAALYQSRLVRRCQA
jgi:hypothetical protein